MAKPGFIPYEQLRSLTEADKAEFRQAVSDVSPIIADKPHPIRKKPLPQPRRVLAYETEDSIDFGLSAPEWLDVESVEGLINYRQLGISHRQLGELRRGHWPIGAEIDLHGITRDEARLVLQAFVAEATHRGVRCIRVIHGKGYRSPNGQSLLKQQVRHWLTQHPHVLAYCQTEAREGGSGAIKVLLKRRQGG